MVHKKPIKIEENLNQRRGRCGEEEERGEGGPLLLIVFPFLLPPTLCHSPFTHPILSPLSTEVALSLPALTRARSARGWGVEAAVWLTRKIAGTMLLATSTSTNQYMYTMAHALASCDGVGVSSSSWWLDRTLELRSESPEPLTRVCLVNYQPADAPMAISALCTFPHAGLSGLRFFDPQHGNRSHGALDASLTLPGRRISLRSASLTSDVRPPASSDSLEAGHCDLLMLDTAPPDSALRRTDSSGGLIPWYSVSFQQSLLLESAHAFELLAKQPSGVLLMHGPPCNETSRYLSADGSLERAICWRSFFDELVEAGSLASPECRQESGASIMCTARVNHASPCTSVPPLLSSQSGRLKAQRTRVRFETGLPQTDRLLAHSARYFHVLPCQGGRSVCLLFKDAAFESWVGGIISRDGGISFSGVPRLVMPKLLRVHEAELRAAGQWNGYARLASLTHNYAALVDADGSYLFVGGKYHVHRPMGNGNTGIWSVRWREDGAGATLIDAWGATDISRAHAAAIQRWNATGRRTMPVFAPKMKELPSISNSRWQAARLLLTGRQKGCVERRSAAVAPWVIDRACEFDGRLSIVRAPGDGGRDELLLYARANLASHGRRHVQFTSSKDGGVTWSKFRRVHLGGGEDPNAQSDIYFFNVVANPALNGSLLAVYPLVTRFRACVCLSASRDGRHWSAPQPLLRCGVAGERATSHPAAGLIERGEHVDLYIHESVPGIHHDFRTPRMLTRFWLRRQQHMPSRLVRFAISKASLREWTRDALQGVVSS